MVGTPRAPQRAPTGSPGYQRQRRCLILAAILLSSIATARARDVALAQPTQRPDRLDEYFALGKRARQGDVEAAIAEIRTWNWRTFRDLREELARLRRGLEGPSQRILDKWERSDIEALAMLHTETAIRYPPLSTAEASHANWAKQLVELFEGMNVGQTFRLRWHIAWGAYLQTTLRLQELAHHVNNALRTWPDDPDLLTMAGSVYESSADRAVLLRDDSDYVPMQLQRRQPPDLRRNRTIAESHYRRALNVRPDLFDARLRLGRALLESNQLDEALDHLTRAAARGVSTQEQYLARLFLGRVYAAQERWSDAVAAYTDASSLLPHCQSSAVALSYAQLKQGDRPKAQTQMKAALEGSRAGRCDDPWWRYQFGYGPRADALLDQLRGMLQP